MERGYLPDAPDRRPDPCRRSRKQLAGNHQIFKNISDEEIVHLNLPTAVPYVFEFDDDLKLVNDYFLGDPEEIKKLMEAVANQGKKSSGIHASYPELFIKFATKQT